LHFALVWTSPTIAEDQAMGHNRAGVQAKQRRRRRIKEEARLAARQQAAETGGTTDAAQPGLLSRAAGAVGGFVKGVVQKVTGGEKT